MAFGCICGGRIANKGSIGSKGHLSKRRWKMTELALFMTKLIMTALAQIIVAVAMLMAAGLRFLARKIWTAIGGGRLI
jgi:hypothetical protein